MELDAILDNLSDEEQIELLELLEEEENYRNTHLLTWLLQCDVMARFMPQWSTIFMTFLVM
ncbi:hypothetical protein ACPX2S_001844 [Escherichia coli]